MVNISRPYLSELTQRSLALSANICKSTLTKVFPATPKYTKTNQTTTEFYVQAFNEKFYHKNILRTEKLKGN